MGEIERTRCLFYENFNGKYYLKSGFTKETMLNKKTDYLLEISDEYILTELKVDSAEQIPFNEQVSYSYTISDKAEEYSLSDWKDYSILENKSIKSSVLDLRQAENMLSRKNPPSKIEKKDKLRRIILKFDFDFSLITYPVSSRGGEYTLQLHFPSNNKLEYLSNLPESNFCYQYESTIKYVMSRNWKLFVNESENILSSERSRCYNGGIEYSIPLKTYGKKIIYSVNAGYGFLKFMKSMGTANNETEFHFGGKKFDSKKIEAFRGINLNGIRLGSDLSFQVTNFFYLKLYGGWQFNFDQTEKIRLKEKDGFFLGLKSAEENLTNEGITFSYNGLSTSETQSVFHNYFVGIGLKCSF